MRPARRSFRAASEIGDPLRGNSRSPRTGRPARWGAGTGGNELVAISTHFFRAGTTGIRECTEKAEIGQYIYSAPRHTRRYPNR